MNIIFQEDITLFSSLRLIFYIIFGCIFFYLEFSKKFQLSYSKFNSNGKFSPKIPMFFIYFLPLSSYLFLFLMSSNASSLYHVFILLGVGIHFSKRCLEVLFLHKYSGTLSLLTSTMITFAYSSIVVSIHETVNLFTTSEMLKEDYLFTSYFGFGLFLIGQISNLYHHVLLSKLRKNSMEYRIPTGGLFPLINCPHYLSEILAWLGIAIMSRYQLVYGLSFVMAAYLVARSINTTKWYHEKIPHFPRERKSLVPYIL
jgi:hypothetical protein